MKSESLAVAWLFVFLLSASALVLGGGGYWYYVYDSAKKKDEKENAQAKKAKADDAAKDAKERDVAEIDKRVKDRVDILAKVHAENQRLRDNKASPETRKLLEKERQEKRRKDEEELSNNSGVIAATPLTIQDKTERIQEFDREAMEFLNKGQLDNGFRKLLDGIELYRNSLPSDCGKTEALAVAVVYSRIAAIGGKQLPTKTTKYFIDAAVLYSERGGIETERFSSWFETVANETWSAFKKNK